MNNRIAGLRDLFIVKKEQKKVWQEEEDAYVLAQEFAKERLEPVDRATKRLLYVLKKEKPVIFPEERIAFTRTVRTVPEIFTREELGELRKDHWLHELGDVCNISVDYTKLLNTGLVPKREELRQSKEQFLAAGEKEKTHYLELQIEIIDAVLELTEKYQKKAKEQGNQVVAKVLERVPAQAPQTFLEALQMFRILHFTMWCGHNYHNTIGRFDQYLFPYFIEDIRKGIYNEESALELLEEFFLSFNRDSDLYPGMQQGDNGQSMVLGGLNPDDTDSYNLLSELCLRASLELRVIDPKINLRVNKNTPMETYVLASKLTKQGLGFPQYSNDDIVIPGLLDLGYSKEDAHNYVVAACWEFIIPGVAMDIPNIEALSFIKAVEDTIVEKLVTCTSFDNFKAEVKKNIVKQTESLCKKVKNIYLFPAPFLSLMMDGCAEEARDISLGAKYNNYGFHGTGVANAADSMAAIRKFVFEEKYVTPEEIIDALKMDFEGYDMLYHKLRYEAPKMGNNIDYVDEIAVELLDEFANSLKDKYNDRGGIFRAGTGSAMYYIWHAKDTMASPDGRRRSDGLGCNYSPSLFAKCAGPVSILQSFAKPNLKRLVNGGPLTLELHDTMFRSEDSIQKVAIMVRSFMDLGGHQLQLNAVNKDTMLEAQKHPENYRNLIVRVWGWSGYFVELDKVYQDHIIQRMEMVV